MKVFALTLAFNEDFFLPRWVSYYGAQLGQENLFILDHGSTDLSSHGLGRANVIRVPRSAFDDVGRAAFISNFFAAMLAFYDAGFVSDADEFVVADPRKYRSLAAFAEATRETAVACIGLELFHVRHLEGEFKPYLPILSQRRHVQFDSWMCKRAFASQQVRFGGGLHTSDQPVVFDEHLFLLHLKNFDYDFRMARQRTTAAWEYGGDFGVHARRSVEYVDELFKRVDQKTYDGRVRHGLEFADELQKCRERTVLNPSGEYDFNLNGGFLSEDLRLLPAEFCNLF
jgi:hypothetical protein